MCQEVESNIPRGLSEARYYGSGIIYSGATKHYSRILLLIAKFTLGPSVALEQFVPILQTGR